MVPSRIIIIFLLVSFVFGGKSTLDLHLERDINYIQSPEQIYTFIKILIEDCNQGTEVLRIEIIDNPENILVNCSFSSSCIYNPLIPHQTAGLISIWLNNNQTCNIHIEYQWVDVSIGNLFYLAGFIIVIGVVLACLIRGVSLLMMSNINNTTIYFEEEEQINTQSDETPGDNYSLIYF